MSRSTLFVGLLLIGTSLAACNRKNGDDVSANDPFEARSTEKYDQFGNGFGKAFRADPNSEPRNVSDKDVTPVSLTAEPVAIE